MGSDRFPAQSVFHTGIDTSGHNQIQWLVILSRSGHISFPLTLVSDRQPQAIGRYDALVCCFSNTAPNAHGDASTTSQVGAVRL